MPETDPIDPYQSPETDAAKGESNSHVAGKEGSKERAKWSSPANKA